jgi:hypothetical protein
LNGTLKNRKKKKMRLNERKAGACANRFSGKGKTVRFVLSLYVVVRVLFCFPSFRLPSVRSSVVTGLLLVQ